MRGSGDIKSVRGVILDTAARLFTVSGVHGTSLNDIASAASLSKGTLYYYYPTKEALIMDVAEAHIAEVTDMIFAWVDTLNRAHGMGSALISLIDMLLADRERCTLHIVLCAECCLDAPELREFMTSTYKKWSVMLEVGTLKIQTKDAAVLRERSSIFFKLLAGMMMLGTTPTEDEKSALVKLVLT